LLIIRRKMHSHLKPLYMNIFPDGKMVFNESGRIEMYGNAKWGRLHLSAPVILIIENALEPV